jgi:hypothetical protein
MNPLHASSEWCERLAAALGDGRFLEDPAAWKEHVRACDVCRASVEGYFQLRERVAQARLEVMGLAPPALDGPRIVERALERYETRCRRAARVRSMGYGAVGVLAIVGLVVWTQSPQQAPAPATTEAADVGADAVAYSNVLFRRIFPPDGKPKYELLQSDPALRAEYQRALDHRSSLVRRTALTALTSSGIELDPARMEEVLRTWNEDLETPVVIAAAGDASHALADALELRRTATLRAVLDGAYVQVAKGGRPVDLAAVSAFLTHQEAEVRKVTLSALAADARYQPDEAVMRIFTTDPVVEVRVAAGLCLALRSGAAGVRQMIAYLRVKPDYEVERQLTHHLGAGDAGRAFATERVSDVRTPVVVAILYAQRLLQGGIAPSTELVDRTLADGGSESLYYLAALAAKAGWDGQRNRLQKHWMMHQAEWSRGDPHFSSGAALLLATWDESVGSAERLVLALELFETFESAPSTRMRTLVGRTATREESDIRKRAVALLERWGATSPK